ncbi:MAG TPA: dTDP-4-dehydrorhamnose 3,5-epimerase [bacterium]|nr:dTDP-4-dehydrorhamnose 3,5-epimerase [bacterium]
MKFNPTELSEVILIEPEVWPDDRGHFAELYHREKYRAAGIEAVFLQDNFSFSCRGALRGLHYQLNKPQAKLVTALAGEIWDVAVDLRRSSPTFKRWVAARLSGENKRQLYIPAGFGHGFCVLSETASVLYKCSELYSPADDRSLRWSDPELAIAWPVQEPMLSKKDLAAPLLAEAELF